MHKSVLEKAIAIDKPFSAFSKKIVWAAATLPDVSGLVLPLNALTCFHWNEQNNS
jgi:hypothetical protein